MLKANIDIESDLDIDVHMLVHTHTQMPLERDAYHSTMKKEFAPSVMLELGNVQQEAFSEVSGEY